MEKGAGRGREKEGGQGRKCAQKRWLSPGRATSWLDTGGRRLHTWVTFLDLELFRKS